MPTKDDIIKSIATQLYHKVERLRRCGYGTPDGLIPGEPSVYLTAQEAEAVLNMVYGDDWCEKLCEEVEVHPDFKDID